MKKFLGIFVLSLFLCNEGFSVESLKKNQKGRIKFESIPTITLNQFLKGETNKKSIKIRGKLNFPKKKVDRTYASSCFITWIRWTSQRCKTLE